MAEHLVSTTDSPEEIEAALGLERHGRSAPAPERGPEPSPDRAEGDTADAAAPTEAPAAEPPPSEPAADETASSPDAADQAPKGKGRRTLAERTAQRRAEIDALTKQRSALRDEIAALEATRAAAAPAEPDAAAAETPPAEQPLVEPNPDEYDTTEAYLKAERAYSRELATREALAAVDARLKADREKDAKDKQEADATTAARRALETYAERRDQFITDACPEYQERLDAAHETHPDLTLTDAMLREVTDLERGPQIVLHLAEHPDECRRIMGLADARAVTRAITRIDQQLERATNPAAQGSPPATPVTSAKPPIKPVGAGRTTPTVSLETLPMSEYVQRRREQRARRQGVR